MKFTETKNDKLEIKKIPMNTDWAIDGCEIPELKTAGFFWVVSGAAGSGKSTYLFNLLTNKNAMFRKFDRVYIISPSVHTLPDNIKNKLPEERLFNVYDEETLEFILKDAEDYANAEEEEEEVEKRDKVKCLLILDDCVAQIKKQSNALKKFIYNRRHTPHNGCFSVIMTTQKYNNIPLDFRTNATHLTFFKPSNKKELQTIFEDVISSVDSQTFNEMTNHFLRNRNDNIYVSIFSPPEDSLYHGFNKIILLNGNDRQEETKEDSSNQEKKPLSVPRGDSESKPSSESSNQRPNKKKKGEN
jgi:hypothetical protein